MCTPATCQCPSPATVSVREGRSDCIGPPHWGPPSLKEAGTPLPCGSRAVAAPDDAAMLNAACRLDACLGHARRVCCLVSAWQVPTAKQLATAASSPCLHPSLLPPAARACIPSGLRAAACIVCPPFALSGHVAGGWTSLARRAGPASAHRSGVLCRLAAGVLGATRWAGRSVPNASGTWPRAIRRFLTALACRRAMLQGGYSNAPVGGREKTSGKNAVAFKYYKDGQTEQGAYTGLCE